MKETKGQWNNGLKIFMAIADVIVFWASYYLAFFMRYGVVLPARNFAAFEGTILWLTISFVIINILFGVYILYNKIMSDFLYITVIIQVIMATLAMVFSFLGRYFAFPRSVILIQFLIGIIMLFAWRAFAFKMYQRLAGVKNVMVVGYEEDVAKAIDNFSSTKSIRHKVTHVVYNQFYENIRANYGSVDIVYLASSIPDEEKEAIFALLMKEEVKIFINTAFENLVMVNPNLMNFEDESIIELSFFKIPPEMDLFKRAFDIILSLVGIIVTLPITVITAILIKRTMPGPIFYKQTRITQGGREFEILKFRSMSVTAEQESGPVLSTKNDARVTPLGKYLRSLRIDELPQLWNVLVGDMSIVGPRPERPFFVDQFKEENPYYYLRHNVRAGITGYAQVYGKYASDFNSKLNFDLIYIKKYSLILDLKIMLQTIKILFDKVSSRGLDDIEKEPLTREEILAQDIIIIE